MLLLWLFLIPFFGACATSLIRNKTLAITWSLIPFIILVGKNLLGTEISFPWFTPLQINFDLHVDALSFIFLLLTAVITPIAIAVADKPYYPLILAVQGLLIGFFTARDLVFFTIFWEAMLIPLYFIINLGNHPTKYRASFKFLLYMLAGSTLMIAAVLALYITHGSFDLKTLSSLAENTPYASLLFGAFALAFAVKTPLFPFHGWLPDTYDQAPTSGTILLSALLSKAGVYGFLRIGVELFPENLAKFSSPLITLAIIGVIYGAIAAYRQNNFKKLFAYSSFSHVNFILAGIFAATSMGKLGATIQAINHGIIITGLFLVSGWLEKRLHSTSMLSASGLAKYFPKLATLSFIFILASIALPGTSGFIGELLILYGLFIKSFWQAALLATSVVLSVIYMLRFMQTIYFQTPTPLSTHETDIGMKNILLALPLIILIFLIGLYPTPLFNLLSKEPL